MRRLNSSIPFILFLAIFIESVKPQMSDGYYYGAEWFQLVFLKKTSDTIIVDFILTDKLPRDLFTDTLFYKEKEKLWSGKSSLKIYKKRNKYLIKGVSNIPFFGKTEMRLKKDSAYYAKAIDNLKNIAVFQKFYGEYLKTKSTMEDAEKKFKELREHYNMDNLFKLRHSDFLIELENFKKEINK